MKLAPEWVSGFVDGEGTFYVGINRNSTMTCGYQILPEFRIVQHKKDIQVLHALRLFFQSGVVRINHEDRYELRIRSVEHINRYVIPHFTTYPLVTQKKFDFLKFKNIIDLINQKQHLTINGVKRIITISSLMNRQSKHKAIGILRELDIMDKIKSGLNR